MWNNCFDWLFKQGEPEGFNDPGISEFKSVKYDGLAREIIQNSLDAKDPKSSKPVKVVFEKQTYDSNYFPGYNSLCSAVDACIDFIKDEDGNKSLKDLNDIKIFLNAMEKRGKFNVMKVSDYNTVGLSGSLERKGTPWANLVRRSGNSNKKKGSGGSFGVGKYAPFVFSSIRTIMYSTKDIEGRIAVQGKSILSGHISNSIERSPKGYFGSIKMVQIDEKKAEDSAPISNPDDIPETFLRKEIGTSLYILCAKIENEWHKEVQNAVINSFFWAILKGILEVEIIFGENTIFINKDTLNECAVDSLQYDNKNKQTLLTIEYLKIFTDIEKVINYTKTFDLSKGNKKIVGEMEMLLLSGKSVNAKSLAHLRETGMKIEDKNYNSLIGYAGVVRTKNEEMNNFLRECEAPKHDEWSSNNYGNTEDESLYAKKILKEISIWERDIVKSLNVHDDSKRMDPLGMEEFLPSDVNDDLGKQKDNEILTFKPLQVKAKIKRNNKQTFTLQSQDGLVVDETGDEELEGGSKSNDGQGGNGEGNGTPGNPGKPGEGNNHEKSKIPIKYIRTPYLNSPGKYLISFISLENHKNCELKIRRVGVDIFEEVQVNKMFWLINGEKIEIQSFDVESNEKKIFEVQLDGLNREALEVSCYAKK